MKYVLKWCLSGLLWCLLVTHPALAEGTGAGDKGSPGELSLHEVQRLMERGWWKEAMERLNLLEQTQTPTLMWMLMRAETCYQLLDIRCTEDALSRGMSLASAEELTRLQSIRAFVREQVGRVLIQVEDASRLRLRVETQPLERAQQRLLEQTRATLEQLPKSPTLPPSMRWLASSTEEPMPSTWKPGATEPALLEIYLPPGDYRLQERPLQVQAGETVRFSTVQEDEPHSVQRGWMFDLRTEFLSGWKTPVLQGEVSGLEPGWVPLVAPGFVLRQSRPSWSAELRLGLVLTPVSQAYAEVIGGGVVQPGPGLQLRLQPELKRLRWQFREQALSLHPVVELGGYWLPGQVQHCEAVQNSERVEGVCYFSMGILTARLGLQLVLTHQAWRLQLQGLTGVGYLQPFIEQEPGGASYNLVELVPMQPAVGFGVGLGRSF
ncbi:MAG: hypothetical protein ACKO6N_20640 [Myxococcota bacterium]